MTGGPGITPSPASHRRHSTRHSRRQWAGSDAGYPGGPGDFPRDGKNRPDAGTPAQKPTPGRAADPAPKSDGRITSDPACAGSSLCARKNFLPRRPAEPAPSMTSAAPQTEPPCYCRRNPNSKTPPLHNRAEESDRIFSRLHLRPATPGPANRKPTPAFQARNQRRRADQTRYEWIPYPLTPPWSPNKIRSGTRRQKARQVPACQAFIRTADGAWTRSGTGLTLDREYPPPAERQALYQSKTP